MNSLLEIKKQVLKEIKDCQDLKTFESIKIKYLGRKSQLTAFLHSLKNLPTKERKEKGKLVNLIKREIEKAIEEKKKKLQMTSYQLKDWLDVTAPAKKLLVGHLHPITQIRSQTESIFQSMGFSVVEGPEIETEWYNFDALNIPQDHPARDLWDTFYLKNGLLLRTHTSPVQVRYLEKNQPPLRIIVPGRVFRHEATDASHEINFYQLEGLMVGRDVSVSNFKAIIEEFFKRFFDKPIKIRLRPSYFPFTEPSFEVDLLCLNCLGNGCSACQKTGWLEIMGAGMVHPNVLKNSGLDSKNWQGFAFGMGLDRLAMMKYKINDIRLFYSSDLRFIKQF